MGHPIFLFYGDRMEIEPGFRETVRILVNNGVPLDLDPSFDWKGLSSDLVASGLTPRMASNIIRVVRAGNDLCIDWPFLDEYDRPLLQSNLHKVTMLKSETVIAVLDLLYEAVAPPASDSIPSLRFALQDGILNVFGTEEEEISVTIPEQVRIDGGLHDVTSIGTRAFWGNTVISDIVMPETIRTIGKNAFWGCTSVVFLNLPGSLESIGPDSFSRCSSITSLTIPESVTTIGERAFASCTSLRNVVIPDSVRSIGDGAFIHCTNLESVVLPESFEYFGKDVFEGCPFLDEDTKARISNLIDS